MEMFPLFSSLPPSRSSNIIFILSCKVYANSFSPLIQFQLTYRAFENVCETWTKNTVFIESYLGYVISYDTYMWTGTNVYLSHEREHLGTAVVNIYWVYLHHL